MEIAKKIGAHSCLRAQLNIRFAALDSGKVALIDFGATLKSSVSVLTATKEGLKNLSKKKNWKIHGNVLFSFLASSERLPLSVCVSAHCYLTTASII